MLTRKYKFGDTGFWQAWLSKLLFTLISVKVWGLIAATSVSTWLLYLNIKTEPVIAGDTVISHGINGAQWVTFNTTVWGIIFGMKEIFRIYELRDALTGNEAIKKRPGTSQNQLEKTSGKTITPKLNTDEKKV